MTATLLIGSAADRPVAVPLNRLNRHILIAGATGTGKTTTAGAICERMAEAGILVLAIDAKGDLEGATRGGRGRVLDPFGERGLARPLDLELIGPDTLARALDLSDAQAGALFVAFRVAEIEGLPLSSLADLRDVLHFCNSNAASVADRVGLISPASAAAVGRALLRLELDAGAAFGVSPSSHRLDPFEAAALGGLTVLSCARLTRTPGLYGAMAAFVLTRLYEMAPEVGDLERPALAVMFDEAHLIFDGAPAAIVKRLEQAVRLIRSKGICCIFATQSPGDLPPAVAGQLQTRIQHGLRAVTPAQRMALKAAADSMPAAEGFDATAELQRLPIGSAIVSAAGVDGEPTLAQVVSIEAGRADLRPLRNDELALDAYFHDPAGGAVSPDLEAGRMAAAAQAVIAQGDAPRPRFGWWRALLCILAFGLLWQAVAGG